MSDSKNNSTKTIEDLEQDIRAADPDFISAIEINDDVHNKAKSKTNVINFKTNTAVEDIDVLDFNFIENDNPPPIQFIMSPIIQKQGIIFIYASSGVGKTYFTLNLAYAIARGGNFLKYSCPQPKRVLYVDGEMAYVHMHDRLMQIRAQQGSLDFKDHFKLITPDKCKNIVPKIDETHGQEIYIKIIEKYNIDVIIFDNMDRLTSVDFDENKTKDWQRIHDFELYLRKHGKTVINVHHTGKDTKGYRGSSGMLTIAHLAISLQPIVDDQVDDIEAVKKFKIVYQKQRLLQGKDALPFEVIFDQDGWRHQSVTISVAEKIVGCVKANMTQREIAQELGLSQTTVYRMIKKLKEAGQF